MFTASFLSNQTVPNSVWKLITEQTMKKNKKQRVRMFVNVQTLEYLIQIKENVEFDFPLSQHRGKLHGLWFSELLLIF